MASWPSISAPTRLTETLIKETHRNPTEMGYVVSRPRCTKKRKKFGQGWSAMSDADKASLETFFDSYQGTSFDWTHPITSAMHTCIFSGDALKFEPRPDLPGYWSASADIEEQP